MSSMRDRILSVFVLVFVVVLSLAGAEGMLRLKNKSMQNYDIEMWRYARELKVPSANPVLGHDHVKNSSALLQSVEIRTNEWGLRGGPVTPLPQGGRRILFLGGSITLGWGVREEDTLTARLQQIFEEQGQPVQVLNAGIGNYNSVRYVGRFLADLKDLEPTDIVVQYFLRDAETLEAGGGDPLLRNSQLAVTLWISGNRLLNKVGETSLVQHYEQVYEPEAPGYIKMQEALERLAQYAQTKNIRLYLAMTPDVHNLADYPFSRIHQRMKDLADRLGYIFVELLPAFGKLSPEEIWALPGDPHPNALGHKLMAATLFSALNDERR